MKILLIIYFHITFTIFMTNTSAFFTQKIMRRDKYDWNLEQQMSDHQTKGNQMAIW